LLLFHLASLFPLFFFHCSGPLRDLHSFPTRRSSDLRSLALETLDAGTRRPSGGRATTQSTRPRHSALRVGRRKERQGIRSGAQDGRQRRLGEQGQQFTRGRTLGGTIAPFFPERRGDRPCPSSPGTRQHLPE